MINISPNILNIIWKITEIFFIFSLILLIILFIVKKIFDYQKNNLETKKLSYLYHSIDEKVEILTDLDLIAYSQVIGLRLLGVTNRKQRREIQEHIISLELYPKLHKLYQKKHFKKTKLYLLYTLSMLADTKGRELYFSIIRNIQTRGEMLEFTLWAFLGLALSTKTQEEFKALYLTLESFDQEEHITQKFSQFFFVKAYISMEESEVIAFLNHFRPEKLTYVTYALVYALQYLPPHKDIYKALLLLHKNYENDSSLLIAILRIQHTWKIKNENLILAYYQHSNVFIRIACAKMGMDMIVTEKFYLFVHYLYDNNKYVRKNILVSFAKHHIEKKTILEWLVNHKLNNEQETLLEKSLTQYTQGVI